MVTIMFLATFLTCCSSFTFNKISKPHFSNKSKTFRFFEQSINLHSINILNIEKKIITSSGCDTLLIQSKLIQYISLFLIKKYSIHLELYSFETNMKFTETTNSIKTTLIILSKSSIQRIEITLCFPLNTVFILLKF